jgi:hypothetical protein
MQDWLFEYNQSAANGRNQYWVYTKLPAHKQSVCEFNAKIKVLQRIYRKPMTLFNILLIAFLGLPLIVVTNMYLGVRRKLKFEKLIYIDNQKTIAILSNQLVKNIDEKSELREENEALKLTASNRELHITTIYQELHEANQTSKWQAAQIAKVMSRLAVERKKNIRLEKK